MTVALAVNFATSAGVLCGLENPTRLLSRFARSSHFTPLIAESVSDFEVEEMARLRAHADHYVGDFAVVNQAVTKRL